MLSHNIKPTSNTPHNKTDIFYISLEKNPGLAKKARQKK